MVGSERLELPKGPGAECTVICGSSFGGLFAAFCGLRHSNVFGNVLSLSGSFYYTLDEAANREPYLTKSGWMMDQYAEARKLPLRFYLQVGLLESGAGWSQRTVICGTFSG